MKKINFIKYSFFAGVLALGFSCTNLDEELIDGSAYDVATLKPSQVADVLDATYTNLRAFHGQGQMYAMEEVSTDAIVVPTRGGDWDDNGNWRAFHVHGWNSEHGEIRGAWNSLLSNINRCNAIISVGTAAQKTEARFLRAFLYFHVIDLFGQAPYREQGSALSDDPKVWSRTEATNFVITELEAILADLPARVAGDASKANKDAAHFLLAKLYLNKGVFTTANPAGPYTFDPADMTKVVQHVDALTNTLAPVYWDNFKTDNNTSPEIIFSTKEVAGQGDEGTSLRTRWFMTTHYNQEVSGWNGFSTLADYYNKFSAGDNRKNGTTPNLTANSGLNLGFLIGQQYDKNHVALNDRVNHPLVFTHVTDIFATGATLETAGVRGMKYEPDFTNLNKPANDYVFMRYADALLMKAEAIKRGGTGSLGTIAADLAARTGVAAVDLTNLDVIYDERGRELWWEGWRRNDMIRFGKFLAARQLKPTVSDSKYILYPIPLPALLNPNLTQNPGY